MQGAAILVMTMAIGAVSAPAAGQDKKAILVLHSYGFDAPGRLPFDTGLVNEFRDGGRDIDLYIETLDPNRFGGEAQQASTRAYLRERYAGKHIAVVVAVLDSALTLALDAHEPILAGVPIVAWLSRFPETPPPDVAVLYAGDVFVRTIDLAMTLEPEARQIVVIDGAPPNSGAPAASLDTEHQIMRMGLDVPISYLRNRPLEEVIERVRALPRDSIVFVVRQYIGWSGAPMGHAEAIREIAIASAGPVFVGTDPLIGSGAVGGAVVNMEHEATQLARLALRVVRDGSARIAPIESTLVPMFDWRALRRWNISEARLPAGSIVQFRQPTMWDQYKSYIVGVAALVLLQSAFIAGLVIQHARRRRTELALRKSEQQHRAMAEQNEDLAGRLITAQDAERTRIARDLHDDVSQQLAGVSIAFSGLRQQLGEYHISAELQHGLSDLQQQTLALARNVRHLSHDLHPTVLQHLGLVKGLTSYCGELGRAHGVVMRCSADGDFTSISPEAALCVYRIAQEALRNVIAHAGASRADIRLLRAGDHVEITIADNGRGFDNTYTAKSGKGLGLVSITERVKIAGGTVSILTGDTQGTRVQARIPAHAHADNSAPLNGPNDV
jgi:signal transduction histidine kinase